MIKIDRSSRPEVFCKKDVLRNFAKFTGKHLCQSLFFRPATLLKKRLWHRCFSVNFAIFRSTPFLTEHLRWLLLNRDLRTFVKCNPKSFASRKILQSYSNLISKNNMSFWSSERLYLNLINHLHDRSFLNLTKTLFFQDQWLSLMPQKMLKKIGQVGRNFF